MRIKAINARHPFQGTVKHIKRDDLVSEVEVDIRSTQILISRLFYR